MHVGALIAQPLVAQCTQALCKHGHRALGAALQKMQQQEINRQKQEILVYVQIFMLLRYVAQATCQKVVLQTVVTGLRGFQNISGES